MDLVIDANIIFSALIAGHGKTHELLFNNTIQLFTPEYVNEEIKKHKHEIIQKTNLSAEELDLALSIIFSRITIIPSQEIGKNQIIAKKISPDPDDSEYFALAIKLKCPIWSNDKKLKHQDKISIINTAELIEILK